MKSFNCTGSVSVASGLVYSLLSNMCIIKKLCMASISSSCWTPSRPHTLEMGSKSQTHKGKNLYAFKGSAFSKALDRQVAVCYEVFKRAKFFSQLQQLHCREMESCLSESAFMVNCASHARL